MKACPTCGRLYPNEAGFCAADGASLLPSEQVPVQVGDDPRLGSTVAGRYHIRRVVADGGMGRVYEAQDRQQDRRVALKMLHSDVANDSVAVTRFKREFQVSSQLPHEHIIDVLDFQQEGGTYALVMEFLDGEELRTALQREKTLSFGRVVRMVSQMAIGLDAAHASKFVHRDLKPDNVFLCGSREGDVVKILDFGSVKDKSENAKKLTMLGTTIGSPYYMAPEQAQGLEADARSDLFALGAVAYRALTARAPFAGPDTPQILFAVCFRMPQRPSLLVEDLPPDIDHVLAIALAKSPEDRFDSATAFAAAMEAAARDALQDPLRTRAAVILGAMPWGHRLR